MKIVVMQKFGYVSNEATVVEWLKSEGDKIEEGEAIAAVETEKAAVELEAPVSGVLYRILVPEGTTVPVGEPLAIITKPGEVVADLEAVISRARAASVQEKKIELTSPAAIAKKEEVREQFTASPAAKRKAREHEIDLTQVKGTGPGGSIVKEDVEEFIQKKKGKEIIPLRGFRKAMAERLAYSVRTYAHVTTTWEVDVTNLLELRKKLKPEWTNQGVRVTFTAFVVKAVVEALKDTPMLNSSVENGKILVKKYYNIGIATSLENVKGEAKEDRLVVPVVHAVEQKNLIEIARALEELARKAKSNSLTQDDITGGTFTISNTGPLGTAGVFTAIINPPESAILGIGSIQEKPVVHNGKIAIRSIVPLCLTYDHRIIFPTHTARFRTKLKELLEKPEVLTKN